MHARLYLEWHMRQALAPMLFDDHEREAGEALRSSAVAKAQPSPAAKRKAKTKRTRRRSARPQLPKGWPDALPASFRAGGMTTAESIGPIRRRCEGLKGSRT